MEKDYVLRFVSGKYQGGDFPIPTHGELVLGRASDLDVVLIEDMVSRRHAAISAREGELSIRDLGSTNGTFVNGVRVQEAQLREGDQILVGTSVMRVLVAKEPAAMPNRASLEDVAMARRRTSQVRTMAGSIHEISLTDLLQLFSASRKTGVLIVRTEEETGRILIEQGRVISAWMDDPNKTVTGDTSIQIHVEDILPGRSVSPLKWVTRMLRWREGNFEMDTAVQIDEFVDQPRLDMTTEAIMLESMRQMDEYERLMPDLPKPKDRLTVAYPLQAALRDLTPDELDVFQLVMHCSNFQSVLDKSALSDLDTAQAVQRLLERRYVAKE